MKTLYLDCQMGAAGDMLTAALLELLPDQEAFINEFNALGIPGVVMKKTVCTKCGITGTKVSVFVHGQSEAGSGSCDEGHSHLVSSICDTVHSHTEDHMHHSLRDIEHFVNEHLNLPKQVKSDILSVYDLLAEAESHAHGVPVSQIHFHEVGNMDAIADITAVCMLLKKLAPEQIVVSPIHVGSGHVHCAHGILPVPAPATAYILKGVPIYGGQVKGELCTPTGAALLKYFANAFRDMPKMCVQKIGYGMGTKDFEQVNCVRTMLGETLEGSERSDGYQTCISERIKAGEQKKTIDEAKNADDCQDTIVALMCNLDDMTAEQIGFAVDRLFEAGALDVYTAAIGMKKSRPGTALHVLGTLELRQQLLRTIFKHTTTIGVREQIMNRYILRREQGTIETEYGSIRYKRSRGYDVERVKFEYEDLARIAKKEQKSLEDINKMIETRR